MIKCKFKFLDEFLVDEILFLNSYYFCNIIVIKFRLVIQMILSLVNLKKALMK